MEQSRRIALVIGSGGAKCAAALGLLQVLQEANITLDMAVGCSGGSLYAAAIALGYSVADQQQMTLDFWTPRLMKDYASNLMTFRSGEKRFTQTSGLVDDGPLNETLRKVFGTRTFADTKMPLYIIATNFADGEQVMLSNGEIFDAVRASSAIPTIFPPWQHQDMLLIDGAASNPLPVDVASQQGADIIIAMGFELSYRKRMRSLTAVNSQLTTIYTNNLLRASFAFQSLAHHSEIITVLPKFEEEVSMLDTENIPSIIAQGQEAAQRELPYLRSLLDA